MERQLYKYWVEIEGKMKGKRKVTIVTLPVSMASLDGSEALEGVVKVNHYVDLLIDTHKPQKGAVWRFMRTVITESTLGDGTVMHLVSAFDVNRCVVSQGNLK